MILSIHTGGYVLSAAMIGMILEIAGCLILRHKPDEGIVVTFVSVLAVAYGLRECGLIRLPMPQFRAQVPVSWQFFPVRVMALLYGLGLGVGFFTMVPVGTFYVIAAWSLACGSLLHGAMTMACFGIGRALPLWLNLKSYTFCSTLSATLLYLRHTVGAINGFALSAVGSGLMWALVSKELLAVR